MTNSTQNTGLEVQPSLKRKLIVILAPILIVALFLVALKVIIGLNSEPKVKRQPYTPLAVMADYAVKDNVQLQVVAQGEVTPRTEIDLVPQVGGKIVYVSPNFIDGGIFRKGETLVRIEDADYNVAVVRAEASVAQAQQALTREIAEGDIARKDYEELGQGQPSDLALRLPQRQQAQAGLQAAEAELQSAKLNLARTHVVAPFSGRVRSKASDVGQFVSPGARLGRIFSTDIVEIRLPLTDSDLAKLQLPLAFVAKDHKDAPQLSLSAVIGGLPQTWQGQIMRTSSVYDTQTRALYAIAEVVDPYGEGASDKGVPLAPGMFVEAHIPGKSYDNVIVIPRDGLRPGDKVYVVDDKGHADLRDVTVLDTTPAHAVLSSGVNPGELIVLSPMEGSRTNMDLKVLDIHDPSNVLVEPPKPEWMVKQEAGEADDGKSEEKRDKKKRKRKKDKDDQKDAAVQKADETGQPAHTNASADE